MVIAKFLTGQVSVEVKDIPVEVFDEFGEFLRQNTIPKHNFTFINGTLAQNVVSGTASEEDAEKIRKWFRERGAKTREEVLVE